MQTNEPNQTATTLNGTIDTVKARLFDWYTNLDLSTANVVRYVSALGVGFFIGFALKRYCKYVIIAVAVLVVAALVLQGSDIIQINWIKVQGFVGISPQDTIDSVIKMYVAWVKAHVALTITGSLGFILGYLIG